MTTSQLSMSCPMGVSAGVSAGAGVSYISIILENKNIPTIKQLKNTKAFKKGNRAFKHISLNMYKHMKELKTNKNNKRTTKSIVNSVLIGYGSEKAKKILISIASEININLQKKEEEKVVIEEEVVVEEKVVVEEEVVVEEKVVVEEEEEETVDSWEELSEDEDEEEELSEDEEEEEEEEEQEIEKIQKNAWGINNRKVYKLTFEDNEDIEKPIEKPVSCVPVKQKIYCPKIKEERMKFTMLCRNLFIKGHCRYGNKCNFAHSIESWKPNTCHFRERCNKGERCRWFHPDRETKEEFAKRQNFIR